MFTLSHFSSRNAGKPLTKAFQCAIFVETTTKKNNKIMMKENDSEGDGMVQVMER